jgi:hypothetical protein
VAIFSRSFTFEDVGFEDCIGSLFFTEIVQCLAFGQNDDEVSCLGSWLVDRLLERTWNQLRSLVDLPSITIRSWFQRIPVDDAVAVYEKAAGSCIPNRSTCSTTPALNVVGYIEGLLGSISYLGLFNANKGSEIQRTGSEAHSIQRQE